jgi:hypothetical protein
VAIVAVLVVAGGLLLHSFWKLQHVDLGFDGERIFTAEMRLLDPRYVDDVRRTSLQSALMARARLAWRPAGEPHLVRTAAGRRLVGRICTARRECLGEEV